MAKKTKKAADAAHVLPTELPADVTEVTSWVQADVALGVLRQLEAERAKIAADYRRRIVDLEQEMAAALQPSADVTKRIGDLVLAWTQAQRGSIKGRSRKLVHGTVGFRAAGGSVLYLAGKDATVKLLKVRGHLDCIKTTEEPVAASLRRLPADELRRVEVVLQGAAETAYYKLADAADVDHSEGA